MNALPGHLPAFVQNLPAALQGALAGSQVVTTPEIVAGSTAVVADRLARASGRRVMPTAPASTCARAIAGIFCVFTCGLSATPFRSAIAAIFSIFRLVPEPSINTCGVATPTYPGSRELTCALAPRRMTPAPRDGGQPPTLPSRSSGPPWAQPSTAAPYLTWSGSRTTPPGNSPVCSVPTHAVRPATITRSTPGGNRSGSS